MKFLIFLITTLAMSLNCILPFAVFATNSNEVLDNNFLKELIKRTKQSVIYSTEITAKDKVNELLDHLLEFGFIQERGSDDLRIQYVHAQGSIEQSLFRLLVLGQLKQLIGVIHTPQPATPLCTEVDLDNQLLASSIRNNLDKQLTVRSRAIILRNYLNHGGSLYIAYPQGGLEKRTAVQQSIYKKELQLHAGYLFDAVLSEHEMISDMVGATYFLRDTNDELYVFSIKSRQANNPSADAEWGLWLGLIDNPIIVKRVNVILNYLEMHEGPPIRFQIM